MQNKKTHKDQNILYFKISIYCLFIFSIIYSFIISEGHYGFGVDYYHAYQFGFPSDYFFSDFFGWLISTLSIYGYKLGVFTTAFVISFSSGLILLVFFSRLNIDNILVFFLVFIVLIHSWPVFPSIVNAMRQGLMMSFIFFGLYFLNYNKLKYSFFFFLITLFTHKSGIVFFILFFILILFNKIKKNNKNVFFLYVIFGIISFLFNMLFIIALNYTDLISINQTNYVIAKDFSLPFLFINIFYILYFSKFYQYLLKNYFNSYIYLFSFFVIGFYLFGLTWQYERFNMIMLIPYIISIGCCFSKKSKTFYILIIPLLLFALTIYTGMYEAGIGIY